MVNHFKKFVHNNSFQNILLIIIILNVSAGKLTADANKYGCRNEIEIKSYTESGLNTEIEDSDSYFFLPINLPNTGLFITELHRIMSLAFLSYNFNPNKDVLAVSITDLNVFRYIQTISIYIRGHAFLN